MIYMKWFVAITICLCLSLQLCGCAGKTEDIAFTTATGEQDMAVYHKSTLISDVIDDPVFGDYGRLIFPTDEWYYTGDTLGDLHLTWYNNIDSDKTVEIVNYLKERVTSITPFGADQPVAEWQRGLRLMERWPLGRKNCLVRLR